MSHLSRSEQVIAALSSLRDAQEETRRSFESYFSDPSPLHHAELRAALAIFSDALGRCHEAQSLNVLGEYAEGDFPLFAEHSDARCVLDGSPLVGHRASGFAPGRGTHRGHCATCGTSTFYDLRADHPLPFTYPAES